jgi:HlyD family secretion protein
LYIAIVAIAALVVVAIVKNRGSDAIQVTASDVQSRTIVETVVANGKIQPETEVIISSEVSGKILELPFNEGAKVKKGELLVKINPDLAQAALDRAVASLNNAKANEANTDARLIQAKAQFRNNKMIYERSTTLRDNGAIAQAEYDNALATFESAEAEVQAAEQSVKAASYAVQSSMATVKEASDSYSRTTIYSPMDGTVSRLTAEVGEQVVGAMQMTGTEIMRVANLDVMEVLVDVNESDIVRVSFGDTALIEVDAYVDRKFKGVVTEIANSAKSTGMAADQVTNFEVKVRILKSSYSDLLEKSSGGLAPFRPGMNATVEVNTETRRNVPSVPIESVTSRTDTSSTTQRSGVEKVLGESSADKEKERITVVFVEREGVAHVRAVKTGIQDDRFIEVIEGLQDGEVVISGPYDVVSQKLMPGDEVETVTKEQLYEKEE